MEIENRLAKRVFLIAGVYGSVLTFGLIDLMLGALFVAAFHRSREVSA